MSPEQILEFVSKLGPIFTAVGVLLAYFSLKANHDWNRRQLAISMDAEWNDRTAIHRRAIEAAFPGIIDADRKVDPNDHITAEVAKEIYSAKQGDRYWKIKSHVFKLLNYLETLAVASEEKVADDRILRILYIDIIPRWHHALFVFIELVRDKRGFPQWDSLTNLVNVWAALPRPGRKAADDPFSFFRR